MSSCLVGFLHPALKLSQSLMLLAETLCDNKEIIETNIRSVKISSPDVGI